MADSSDHNRSHRIERRSDPAIVQNTLADRAVHQALENYFTLGADQSQSRFKAGEGASVGEDDLRAVDRNNGSRKARQAMGTDDRRQTRDVVQSLEDDKRRVYRNNHWDS